MDPGRRRRRGPAVLLALLAVLVTACTTAPPPAPAGTTLSSVDVVAARLSRAIAARDAEAFTGTFTADDHAQASARSVFDNLGRCREVTVTAAGAGQLRVAWRVDGDSGPVQDTVTVEWSADARRPLAGLKGGSEVAWLARPMAVLTEGPVTVIAAGAKAGATADHWLAAAATARDAVRARSLGALARDWTGRVVVVLPADLLAFGTLAGARPGELQQIAAVTRPETGGALRIVVNPSFAERYPAQQAAVLLTHEVVHLAIGSPGRSLPAWMIEGLAESVTAAAFPAERATSLSRARAAVVGGLPQRLPTAADLTAIEPVPARRAYALAGVAFEALVARRGWTAALRELAGRDAGRVGIPDATILAWYRHDLRRLG